MLERTSNILSPKNCSATLLIAGFLILIQACGGTAPHRLPVSLRTHIFQADLPKTMQAAVSYLSSEGYPNIEANNQAGIINTDFRTVRDIYTSSRTKITLTFQQLSQNETKVIATMTLQVRSDGDWADGVYTSESDATRAYQLIFEGINGYLRK
ncbi:MAG: hypothetical protein ACP5JH_10835 [Bacteroidota bacterium]